MPVDWSKYPKNWKEIRARILLRDNNSCKICGIRNYSVVRWHSDVNKWERMSGTYFHDELGAGMGTYKQARACADHTNECADTGWIVIVLTIMHLDHNTENNDDSNLAAGCQRCHNRHDIEHRKVNSRATIEKKKHLQRLF